MKTVDVRRCRSVGHLACAALLSVVLLVLPGTGLFLFAVVGCLFVIAVLWILESFEPAARSRFDLKIASKNAEVLQPEVESAMKLQGVSFELRGSASDELHYEVTVPYHQQIRKLTRLIRDLGGRQAPRSNGRSKGTKR